MRAVVSMLLSFMFIIIGIVRALVFESQTITQETYILGNHNIKLHLFIKNPVY